MNARISRLGYFAFALVLCVTSSTMAQKQAPGDKPWRELVSSEGHFRVLLPDTPDETFLPYSAQIIHTEVRVFSVRRPEAFFAVLFGDYPNQERDLESIRQHFDACRERALAESKLILMSEKDISTANTPAREFVFDDGAFVLRARLYYSKGLLYETVFGAPRLNQGSAGLAKYYDGLATKFLNSFKIGA